MIVVIIMFLIIFFITNYFKSIENFETKSKYGYVACPPQFTKVGNNMYYNEGNIGIGLEDPSSKLHVKGDTKLDGALVVNGTTQSQFTGGILLNNGWYAVKGSGGIYWEDYGGGWNMLNSTWITSFGTKHVYMDRNVAVGGYLGVGTSDPKYRLDVKGDTKIDGALVVNSTTQSQFTGGIIINNDWCRVKGGGGIYWQDYAGGWFMQDSKWIRSYNKDVWISHNGGCHGNFGIGTDNPVYKLDVHGGGKNSEKHNFRLFHAQYKMFAGNTSLGSTVARFNGSIWVTAWIGSSSDERIKKDIN